MPFTYTLIVSQFYFSRHMRIVERPENFQEVAKQFIDEIQPYKRGEGYYTDYIRYGDLADDYYRETSRRHNINDSGDVYFLHSNDLEELKSDWNDYKNDTIDDLLSENKRSKEFKKIRREVEKRHDEHKVYEMIDKYFKGVGVTV